MQSKNRKKIRGKSRLFNNFLKYPHKFDHFFPGRDENKNFWNDHLPINQSIIDGEDTKKKIRRQAIETILIAYQNLIKNRPQTEEFIKVVASITLPNIFYSQLHVFFSEKYYKDFFFRNSEVQKWIKLSKERSLFKEWNLNKSLKLPEIGFTEEIHNGDYNHVGEIWFYGDVDIN